MCEREREGERKREGERERERERARESVCVCERERERAREIERESESERHTAVRHAQPSRKLGQQGRCKATWKRQFNPPWRKAGLLKSSR